MLALPTVRWSRRVRIRKWSSKVSSQPDGLIFTYEGKEPLRLKYANFKMQEVPGKATVWKMFYCLHHQCYADDWFSDARVRVELLFSRAIESCSWNSVRTSFRWWLPIVKRSAKPLDELNRRSPEVHSMDQFRTNFVVSNTEAFAEDGAGSVSELVRLSSKREASERCILTTVDVERGEFRATKRAS